MENNTIPTNKGELNIGQILDHLQYSSYAANRGYGMTHEQLVSIGIGNDAMKEKYERENQFQVFRGYKDGDGSWVNASEYIYGLYKDEYRRVIFAKAK